MTGAINRYKYVISLYLLYNCFIDNFFKNLVIEQRRSWSGLSGTNSPIHKNLAVANRSRISCAYVDGINGNAVNLKSKLNVTQDHRKRHHWIDHTRLTITRVI